MTTSKGAPPGASSTNGQGRSSWNRREALRQHIQEMKGRLQAACDSVEVPIPADMDDEWSTVLTLAEPGSLFAFSADLGPDHYRYIDGRPRFIDFGASQYQPALV